MVVLAATVYFTTQLALIGTVIALSSRRSSWRHALGSGETNALEATTVLMGCFAAVTLVQAPALLVAMVPIALVIHRTVLIRQLRAAADHDQKTGLLNAAGWRSRAERELARAGRHGTSLGVLVIDLDRFKLINDAYGHLAGDEVLAAVAGVFTTETRGYDLVGRFGGEEFVILLPGADTEQTAAAGERICLAIRQLAVPVEESNAGTVVIDQLSASVGASCSADVSGTLDELLMRADAALLSPRKPAATRSAWSAAPAL